MKAFGLLLTLLLLAEAAPADEPSPNLSPTLSEMGLEKRNDTDVGPQIEPVLLVANITEAMNTTSGKQAPPIQVLAKATLLDKTELPQTPQISVKPPVNATEPLVLLAKVPAEKPVEIHASVPLNTPVNVITEVAPEVPQVALVVHRP